MSTHSLGRALCATFLLGTVSSVLPGHGGAHAASLEATVRDATGLALEHAVVSLHTDTPSLAPAGTRADMDQQARQFAPTVVAIQAGTDVFFPNSDDVRHHVYSFSQPNAFELKLYHGEASSPVRFDEPGIVVLGCNIHDSMIGYLAVVDTPLFGVTSADGEARIDDVTPGTYTLQVWHPDLGTRHERRAITLGTGRTEVAIELDTMAPPAAALPGGNGARAGTAPATRPALSPLQALFGAD